MIIPATGWCAVYRRIANRPDGGQLKHTVRERLVAWREDDHGNVVGLVASDDRFIRPADEDSGFLGYDLDDRIVAFSDAPGVVAVYKNDDGNEWRTGSPVVWVLKSNGDLSVAGPDRSGWFEELRESLNFVRLDFDSTDLPFDDLDGTEVDS